MILKIADWQFQIDKDTTLEHTTKNASDHCECAYCRNYYEAVELAIRDYVKFLENLESTYPVHRS